MPESQSQDSDGLDTWILLLKAMIINSAGINKYLLSTCGHYMRDALKNMRLPLLSRKLMCLLMTLAPSPLDFSFFIVFTYVILCLYPFPPLFLSPLISHPFLVPLVIFLSEYLCAPFPT